MNKSSQSNRLGEIATVLCLSAVLLLSTFSVAQPQDETLSVEKFRKLLADNQIRFEDYKTTNTWNGSRHPPILDTHFKRLFKTVLTEAAKGDPNFDGKLGRINRFDMA